MIKIINNVIKPAKLKQFKECVDNVEFPFYLRKHTVTGSKQTDYVFEHCLIKKKEDRKDPLNSNWANFFINIFQDFCTKIIISCTPLASTWPTHLSLLSSPLSETQKVRDKCSTKVL